VGGRERGDWEGGGRKSEGVGDRRWQREGDREGE